MNDCVAQSFGVDFPAFVVITESNVIMLSNFFDLC